MPDYSIVVPTYQSANDAERCVRALTQQTLERACYEIIVVDDGSSDDTIPRVRSAGADRILVQTHQGPAAARNTGAAAATGRIVLFTDADCEPAPAWLERMVAPFDNPNVMGTKGSYRTDQRALVARLVQLEYEIRYERMAQLDSIDFVDTYAAAYRRRLLLDVGGFDPTYPIPSAEDIDLSFRIADAGHRLIFVPDAWVCHRHPTSFMTYFVRKGRYGIWRALLYLRFTDKIGGDAHTDPMLKVQFALAALGGTFGLIGMVWTPAFFLAVGTVLAFLATTIPFVRWALRRDPAVALIWPAVTAVRVVVQGTGLAFGLVYHSLVNHGTMGETAKAQVDER